MIPNKSNFKFQELTPITGVKPYVIRFWETEFSEIAPLISDSGHKLYGRKDVEAILHIKKLLFEDKLSIPEAKVAIKNLANESPLREQAGDLHCLNREALDLLVSSLALIKEIKLKRNW